MYTTGQFMKLAHITKKTVRYYDEKGILKPSYVDPEKGNRFYTDDDLAKLQQILLLKSLGFSLNDIKELTINNADSHFISESLKMQQKLVEDRIEQLQAVAQTISETAQLIDEEKQVDWSHMLDLIHNLGMENSMKNQYQNASNISSRINLHALYSKNKEGWFPWIYRQCNFANVVSVLELGCGDGSFWVENAENMNVEDKNAEKINTEEKNNNINIVLSDISEGMLRDTRRSLGAKAKNIEFQVFGCEDIPYEDESFDLVIANHVLFYCDDIERTCGEIKRVLKPGGKLVCSTYGNDHMKEISQLVSAFDDRIVLSANRLYERFGKENGKEILEPFFEQTIWHQYEDELIVPEPEPLISYVLSCHGNQNQYILDRYKEFRTFVKIKVGSGFHITKDAGIFICRKSSS